VISLIPSTLLCAGQRKVPARLVGHVPWVNLSRNNQTYLSPKLNSFGDRARVL
jgi:hypothetical protein